MILLIKRAVDEMLNYIFFQDFGKYSEKLIRNETLCFDIHIFLLFVQHS